MVGTNGQATKKIQEGGSKQVRQAEEVEFPDMSTVTKLNMLATSRLSELVKNASPAEKSAVAKLIGNVKTDVT